MNFSIIIGMSGRREYVAAQKTSHEEYKKSQ